MLREEGILDRCVGFSIADGSCSEVKLDPVRKDQSNETQREKGQGQREGLLAQELPGVPPSANSDKEPRPTLLDDVRRFLPGAVLPDSLTERSRGGS